MAKYRKKPVVIEAIQFNRENQEEVIKFTNGNLNSITIPRCLNGKMIGRVETLEGTLIATEKDYIIKGIKGEFYPCKPDIFEATYEKV